MTEDNTAADLVEVKLQGDIPVKLPKAEAEKYLAARAKDKSEREVLAQTAGSYKAEKDAAEAARAKAERDVQAAELTKKGEFDKATELLTKTAREREDKIATKLRDKHLAAALALNAKVVPGAVSDIVEQVRGRTKYDFETDAVVVLGDDGKPMLDGDSKPLQVDTWLNGWLDKRPHYVLDKTPAGSGANAGSKASGKIITEATLNGMAPLERAKFFADGGSLAKT